MSSWCLAMHPKQKVMHLCQSSSSTQRAVRRLSISNPQCSCNVGFSYLGLVNSFDQLSIFNFYTSYHCHKAQRELNSAQFNLSSTRNFAVSRVNQLLMLQCFNLTSCILKVQCASWRTSLSKSFCHSICLHVVLAVFGVA